MLRLLGLGTQVVLVFGGMASISLAAGNAERERLQLILADIDKGEWQGAQRLADGPNAALLQPYVRWRELLERTDTLPFSAYVSFMRTTPDWPSLGTLQIRAEDSLDAAIPYKKLASPSSLIVRHAAARGANFWPRR